MRQNAGQRDAKDRSFVGAVGEQLLEEGKQAEERRQQGEATIAILNVGGVMMLCRSSPCVSTRTCRFLPLISLPASKPGGSMRGPPFSALFTLWLSMMQAVGLASRSAFSRHLT